MLHVGSVQSSNCCSCVAYLAQFEDEFRARSSSLCLSFRIEPVAKFAVPWKWIQPILLSAVSRYADLELGTRLRTEPHTDHL